MTQATVDYYLVQHGKCAALGSFRVIQHLPLRRGDQVVVQGVRGIERGEVLGPASIRQSRLLGDAGLILRAWTDEDEAALCRRRSSGEELFQAARSFAQVEKLPLEVLDVDLPMEGPIILQVLAPADIDATALVDRLRLLSSIEVRLENLAAAPVADEEPAAGGCGKPDCGKTEGGGCTSCSDGGCSSCGTGHVDLKPYFAHLREQMEERQRVPLV